jgi:uncharacterized protein (DUF1810 family)
MADAADPYDLDRFIQAEERGYEQALSEVKDGRGYQVLGTSWLVTKPTPTGSPVKSHYPLSSLSSPSTRFLPTLCQRTVQNGPHKHQRNAGSLPRTAFPPI